MMKQSNKPRMWDILQDNCPCLLKKTISLKKIGRQFRLEEIKET